MSGTMTHRPLANLSVPGEQEDGLSGARPPEPPTRPITGPVFELKAGKHFCRVPGCSKPNKEFEKRNAIAIHVARRHGLNLEGKPAKHSTGTRPLPLKDPAPDWKSINVRDVLSRDNVSLIFQAVRVLEQTRDNMTGKLTEMELLKRKHSKIDMIIGHLRELLPGPGPTAPPA